MVLLEICLIVCGVLIVTVINIFAVKKYIRDKEHVDGKTKLVYQPAEQDNMGHLYYWGIFNSFADQGSRFGVTEDC